MFFIALALAMLVGLVCGGSFRGFSHFSFKRAELIVAAFGIQLLVNFGGDIHWVDRYGGSLHILSYLVLFLAVWMNRSLSGMVWIAAGILSNFLAIALNSGKMPVSRWGMEYTQQGELLQLLEQGKGGIHALMDAGTRLKFLADIFVLPRPYYPLPTVYSLGDVLIIIGLFIMVQRIMAAGRWFRHSAR